MRALAPRRVLLEPPHRQSRLRDGGDERRRAGPRLRSSRRASGASRRRAPRPDGRRGRRASRAAAARRGRRRPSASRSSTAREGVAAEVDEVEPRPQQLGRQLRGSACTHGRSGAASRAAASASSDASAPVTSAPAAGELDRRRRRRTASCSTRSPSSGGSRSRTCLRDHVGSPAAVPLAPRPQVLVRRLHRRSSGGQREAAVDDDRLAADHLGVRAAEERDRAGHVVRRVTIRPAGVRPRAAASISSRFGKWSSAPVSTTPPETALTRIPRGASSTPR